MPRRALLLLTLFALIIATPAAADWRQWVPGADYDPSLPDPGTWTNGDFGRRSMSVDEIHAYLEALAAASDRVRLEMIGASVQGDPLVLVVIADPEGHAHAEGRGARVDALRDAWARGSDERRRLAAAEEAACWIAGSVHGDEATGADAAVLLAWHLAADRSEATARLLERSTVLIDPCQNPDGRRRFLQQVRNFGRQVLEPDPSPWAAEHWSTWPGARTNHFLFDLNRDWAFLTQAESRARAEAFLRWRPQVFVDLHEMGRQSSYFFPPPTDPINPNIPASQLEWFDVFGEANARAFDERGFDYFVGESFDLFYPGFGDSWPTLQGAIGMTYEQASTRGRLMRRPDGSILGYDEAVQHHFVASLTTVQTTARHSAELMESVVDFGTTMRQRAEEDDRREFVFPGGVHLEETRRLAEVLARQGVKILRTTEDSRAELDPVGPDPSADSREVDLPAGTLRIPLDQPAYALVRSLLELHTPMDAAFIAEEEQRVERGLHSRVYDVTAWSMILAYGVEAFTSSSPLRVASEEFDWREADPAPEVPEAAVAWIFPCRDNSIYRTLGRLWDEEIVVHAALDGVAAAGTLHPRGSLVVKRSANPGRSDLAERIAGIVAVTRSAVVAVDRSWDAAGPSLGSNRVVTLQKPRIALLSGPGVSPLSVGALTWLFEERYGIEFTVVLLEALEDVAISAFDVLVVPELRPGSSLPLDRLDGWVREGGVMIAIGSASSALIDHEDEEDAWTSVKRVDDLAQLGDEEGRLGEFEVGPATADEAAETVLPPERRPLRIPGAIFRVQLDPMHELTAGKGPTVAVPVLSDRILTPSVGGRTLGHVDEDAPLIAGYTWPVMEEALKGQAWLVEEQRGRGRVILFAEDPSFRGTWEGLHGLLLNAVMLAPHPAR